MMILWSKTFGDWYQADTSGGDFRGGISSKFIATLGFKFCDTFLSPLPINPGSTYDGSVMVMLAENYLGHGMYTPAEAGMYARVRPQLITRWLYGASNGRPAISPRISDPEEKMVSFLDLVQAMAIRAIRTQADSVSLTAIREAVEFAEAHGVSYPFARKHTTFQLGKQILIQTDQLEITEASGRHRGQLNMRKIVEMYIKDVGFDATGLANSFMATADDGVKIILRPGYKFGEPIVHPTGISAWTLWEACNSNGGAKEAAKAFGVKEKEVTVAYRYIESIRPATAA